MTNSELEKINKYDLLFESRLSKVETSLDISIKNLTDTCKEIKHDLRWMFGIMLGFSGIILSLMAKGFHWFS